MILEAYDLMDHVYAEQHDKGREPNALLVNTTIHIVEEFDPIIVHVFRRKSFAQRDEKMCSLFRLAIMTYLFFEKFLAGGQAGSQGGTGILLNQGGGMHLTRLLRSCNSFKVPLYDYLSLCLCPNARGLPGS